MRCTSAVCLLQVAALAAATETYNFLIHGDWGSSNLNQTVVAEQMGIYGEVIDAEFVIALGDNFYDDGILNVTDPLWDSAFHDVYTHRSLQVPWYPILGNHDYHVNVEAQIQRTYSSGEDIWTFPANYYKVIYKLNDGGRLTIVYIDTQILEPNHDDTQIIFENPDWETARYDHLRWIDETLENAKKSTDWLVVAGHYPIYSVGVNCDSNILLALLQPLLAKHGVHMYIAGHDHNTQYTPMPDGVVYVVSGQSGGRGPFGQEGVRCMGESLATDYIQSYYSECSFAYAEVDSKQLSISFVNAKGMKKFTGILKNPFEHDIVDEIIDAVNDQVFDGRNRGVVEIAMEVTAPVILFGMVFGFFISFRNFFGCVRSDPLEISHNQGHKIDVSTRSTTGLMDSSVSASNHFLDDDSSYGSLPDRAGRAYA